MAQDAGSQVQSQRVSFGVPANAIQIEIVGIATIERCYSVQNVRAVIIHRAQRRVSSPRQEKLESFRWIRHPFVGIGLYLSGMIDGDQLKLVGVERLFKLISHLQLESAVSLLQLIVADAHVLNRIGCVVMARTFEISHFTATHKVRYELKAFSIPGVEKRTRRRFAIQLGYIKRQD